MARRTATLRPPGLYQYPNHIACEEAGNHVIELTVWPPKIRAGVDPTVSARCTKCGCWCQVSPDNDPEHSGIEIVVPTKAKVLAK